MLKFLSAFVPTLDAKPLVFDGTSTLKKRAVDPDSAYDWYRKTQKYVGWESYSFTLFGEKRMKSIPILLPEYVPTCKTTDSTTEANEVIRTLSK